MKDQEQLKAINQLLALVIGGRIARQTEHLKSAPINRINHAQKIIADGELQEATRDLQDGYDGASKRLSQVERKIDSLKSLKVLAEMVEENVELYSLTKDIRDNFNKEEILEIFEYMWTVVLADGKIDDFEAALMSKLVGLFHLTGKESADAKKKAMSHQ